MKRLDILLRNKLSWHESEVQEAELAAIIKAMPEYRKKRRVWPFLLSGILLMGTGIGIGVWIQKNSHKSAASLATEPFAERSELQSPLKTPFQNAGASEDKNSEQIIISNKSVENKKHPVPSGQTFAAPVPGEEPIAGSFPEFSQDEAGRHLSMSLASIRRYAYFFTEAEPVVAVHNQTIMKNSTTRMKKFQERFQPVLSFWSAPLVSMEKNKILNQNSETVHKNYHELTASAIKPLYSVSAGMSFQIRMMPVFSVASGVSYYSLGESYRYNYKINNIPVIDSATSRILGYLYKPDSLAHQVYSKGVLRRTFLEIPLRLHFEVFKYRSLTFALEPAVTLQFLKHSSGETIDRQSLRPVYETVKSKSTNLQMGIPVSFALNGPFGMSVTPFAGRTINNMSLTDGEKKVLLYGGIRLALNYKLFETNK